MKVRVSSFLICFTMISCVSSDTVKLKVIITPGFTGKLRLVNDPTRSLSPGKTYVLRQVENTLPVPDGWLSSKGPVTWYVIGVEDSSGRVLTTKNYPAVGEVGVLGMEGSYDPDFTPAGDHYYFIIGKRTK